VLIHKAFRFRLYPDAEQEPRLRQTAGCVRTLYNAALEERQLRYRSQRRARTSYEHQANQLPALKREFPWLKQAPAQCLQQGLVDLARAFDNFFSGTHDYPSFRKKGVNDSFRFPQPNQFAVSDDWIELPKFGRIRCKGGRSIEGEPKSITVKLNAGIWYASVSCVVEVPDPAPPSGGVVGVDVGVKHAFTCYDGERDFEFDVPRMTPRERERLRRLQQRLARQKKGSNNRRKTRLALQQFHARHKRRRLDALHRATFHLAKNHREIRVEDLDVSAMTRSAKGTLDKPGKWVRQKAGLNRAILEVGWGEFARQLKYKSGWYGSTVRSHPAPYTSQTCSQCLHTAAESRIEQAVFRCVSCGFEIHADQNAARIHQAGGVPASACGAGVVLPATKQEASRVSRGSPTGKARQNPRP
jgi:putative transposase